MRGIVVGVNGSVESDEALDWAMPEAASRQVPLTAVYVTRDGAASDEAQGDHDLVTDMLDRSRARTGSAAEATVHLASGPAADALLAAADDADMLVLGRRRRGRLGRRVLGSVSTTVAEHARMPVTVVRHGDPADPEDGTITRDDAPRPAERPKRVVVGVDTSEPSIAALRHAAEVAVRRDAELEAVFAWQITTLAPLPGSWGWAPPIDDYERFAREALDAAVRKAGVTFPVDRLVRTVAHGQAAKVLVASAGAADRLVVGARGLGGFDRLLLGSVSRQVLDYSPCPVTVVRG
ncbi:universal stress protein [Isoptericola sp. NEAU-Y5]|uniref:Universal stress protein n=1 Tax=Isoptericola luteus TaxID=2879484 RepID=A0ABS7ZD64_9MICO|nr:universal stress protein [Isoptericola sp. NEAU-Y5]MCA5892206.1 universal stress protein [Isoptericola sp. NEAU-Y5]